MIDQARIVVVGGGAIGCGVAFQLADGNPADDLWAYAVNRFERCKALMATPAFADHLRAVRRGP